MKMGTAKLNFKKKLLRIDSLLNFDNYALERDRRCPITTLQ